MAQMRKGENEFTFVEKSVFGDKMVWIFGAEQYIGKLSQMKYWMTQYPYRKFAVFATTA